MQLARDCEIVASVTNKTVQLPWRVVLVELNCGLRLLICRTDKSRGQDVVVLKLVSDLTNYADNGGKPTTVLAVASLFSVPGSRYEANC